MSHLLIVPLVVLAPHLLEARLHPGVAVQLVQLLADVDFIICRCSISITVMIIICKL